MLRDAARLSKALGATRERQADTRTRFEHLFGTPTMLANEQKAQHCEDLDHEMPNANAINK